jgi:hypothetical protein
VHWLRGRGSLAQSAPVNIRINVTNAALPVCVGVPIGEKASVFDASQLGVTDAAGAPVPAQMRVLARWRGPASDAGKPIKWLLVDFKPAAAGAHVLARAARKATAPVTVLDTGAAIRLANSQLEIEFSKQGEALIRGFRLGGTESLRAPLTIQTALARRALIAKPGASPDTVIVTDATPLKVGDEARFEHTDTLKWDASAGTARLVTSSPQHAANRTYRIDEGTPRQEDVTISAAQPGDLSAATLLRFNHGAGATLRDLTAEQDVARIKNISGQTVQFTSPLKLTHGGGETLVIAGASNQIAAGIIERAGIEESNPLRVILRQDGVFRTSPSGSRVLPQIGFTLRYIVYADQPFIRVRLRLVNRGAYGFGAGFTNQPPYAQHALLRSLSVLLPTSPSPSGANVSQILTAAEARAALAKKQSGASLSAGAFEIAVPEFVENYPKTLRGDSAGLRFDILPDTSRDYVFDGARAKTTDFYLGRNTVAARALTNSMNASLDPAYVAGTGAVRPVMAEKRDWTKVFANDAQLGEAATLAERMFASSYAVEANRGGGASTPMSVFEYRESGQHGEHFGWRNFGDLAWGDGYANVHYDLPFILLREYLRTGDARAFRLGGEMARYRADWGQHQGDDYLNAERTMNFKGMAFYEKGDHGSFREPVPSHVWIEGLWLYWALTGDEAVRESAMDASEAFFRMNFAGSLDWGEPRWLGWPTLGLMAAWRYTGDPKYLSKAREAVTLFAHTEESFGRKGYYLVRGLDGQSRIQPWGWSYSLLGVIEYWRETGDARAAGFLVRVADWLVAKGDNPPIKPGVTLGDGTYLPAAAPYFWYTDHPTEDRAVVYAGMTLPVLAAAARITGRNDLWERARLVFRDYAFYRDLTESKPVPPQARQIINFRSLMYPASAPKVYGQMGLTVSEYLPELLLARRAPGTPTPTPKPIETTPTPAASPKPAATIKPPASGPVNLALNKPVTASSHQVWDDCVCLPQAANDGLLAEGKKTSSWNSALNTNQLDWWQVDLGAAFALASIEIAWREDMDQAQARRNFEVLGSNDPAFASFTRLAAQGDAAVPFRQTWRATVSDTRGYRYIRVRKTKIETDIYKQQFFNLAEVRLFAKSASATPAARQSEALSVPAPRALPLDELSPRKVLVGQTLDLLLARHDERGRELQLYASNLPAGALFDAPMGRLRFSPTLQQAGTVYQIAFRAMNDQTDRVARLDIAVAVDGAPDVKLTAPGASAIISPDQPVLIAWSTSHSTPMAKYEIRLSSDGGASYPALLAELPGSATRYQWTLPRNFPLNNRSSLRVMVRGADVRNRSGVDFSRQDLRAQMSR